MRSLRSFRRLYTSCLAFSVASFSAFLMRSSSRYSLTSILSKMFSNRLPSFSFYVMNIVMLPLFFCFELGEVGHQLFGIFWRRLVRSRDLIGDVPMAMNPCRFGFRGLLVRVGLTEIRLLGKLPALESSTLACSL